MGIVKTQTFNHRPNTEIELKINRGEYGGFDVIRNMNDFPQQLSLNISRARAEWLYFDWLQFDERVAFESQWGPRKDCANR